MPRRNHPKKRQTIHHKGSKRPQEEYAEENEYGF